MFLPAALLSLPALASPNVPDSGGGGGAVASPNVLVVLVDDWGMDMLEIYGTGNYESSCISRPPMPNVEGLIDCGVTFRNAWVMPVCSPTRASLLTGRMPYRTGIGWIVDPCQGSSCPPGDELADGELTIPELLGAAAGMGWIPAYASAAIGKWHLGPDPTAPLQQGFERFLGSQSNIGRPDNPLETYCRWVKNVDGVTQTSHTYATTDNVDDALDFIADQGTSPWFVYLAFNAGHTPFHVPPQGLAPSYFVDAGGGACVHEQLPSCPALPAACPPLACPPMACEPACKLPPSAPIPQQVKAQRPYYEAMIEALDTELGRLLDGVDLANTVVFLLGDNGTPGIVTWRPFLGNRDLGIPGKAKGTLYQGGVNVPFVVAGAGVVGSPAGQPPRTTESMIHVVDVFATVAELVGIDGAMLAALTPNPIDSRSFGHVLADQPGPERRYLFSESFQPNFPPSTDPCTLKLRRTVRNLDFKLIRLPDPLDCAAPPIELMFDLLNDPFEATDLIAAGDHLVPGEVQMNYLELSAELDALPLP